MTSIKSIDLWTPENFEVSTYYNEIKSRKNKITNVSGLDNTGLCIYTFNEFGFRSDTITKPGFKIMSIGCSVTEGVGVNDNETWPSIFSSLIKDGVNLNFAYGGRSNDYISRCLLTFYDFIKPDLVLIMYTEPHRRDHFTENGGVEPFHFKGWGYFDDKKGKDEHTALITLSNNESDFQNWYKNHQLIKLFLESKKCNWLWNGWYIHNDYVDNFRFDSDYYPFIDIAVDNYHPGPKTHKKYAFNLYKYIIKKFPDYLPHKSIL